MGIMSKTILLITPDYVSHLNPLIPVGVAFQKAGYKVVVATGRALKVQTQRLGFDHVDLIVGEESNTGLVRADRALQIRASVEATSKGWIFALMEQAEGRSHAFLWNAQRVAARTLDILASVQPSCVLAVQLTYAAVAALLAVNAPFATFVTGHPAQLPSQDELYGYPTDIPPGLSASADELAHLRTRCKEAQRRFTIQFNELLLSINASATCLANGLAAASPRLVLFNYPAHLAGGRDSLFPHGRFIGSSIRTETLDAELSEWLGCSKPDRPTVYCSFGSYFSLRDDVLHRVAAALRKEDVRVVLATGVADVRNLGRLPRHWLARPYFPQVAVLPFCDIAICHGGNNTVTEALAAGVSVVIAPFASDQFSNAITIDQYRLGTVFDPNRASVDVIRQAIQRAFVARPNAVALGRELRAMNGPEMARIACEEVILS